MNMQSVWLKQMLSLVLTLAGAMYGATASAAPALAVGTAQGVAGQTASLPVTFENDAAVVGVQFDIQYDANQLSPGAAQAGAALVASGHGVSSSTVATNTLRVVVKPSADNLLLPGGEVATLPWTIAAAASGGVQALTITNVILSDGGAAAVSAGALTNGAIAINSIPVAGNQTITTSEDQAASGVLAASDSDGDPLTYLLVGSASHGTATLTNPATGAFTYTPDLNANGADSFTFKVSDGQVESNVATVTINITAVNDAPVLSAIGNRSVNEGASQTISLSASDADSGDTLSFSVSGLPAFATFIDNGNRTASISLAPDYAAAGSYNIAVTVADNGTPILSAGESFTLTVNNVNTPPTANAGLDQSASGGAAVTLSGSGSDGDIGDAISSYAWTQVGGTTVTLSSANTATASFTAPAVTGTTSLTFQLTVADNNGATGSDQMVVTVVPTGQPDLSLSAIGSPITAAAGATITVSNTVSNNGAADAEGNFDVGVYLIPEPVVLLSTFNTGTLEGWSNLMNGTVSAVLDATDGWVLKKAANDDPNGGKATLANSVGDFELTVYTKRLSIGVARTNSCYSLTGSSGNGYGLCLNYGDGKLYLNKRDSWNMTNLGTAVALAGGAVVNQWYTLQLTKQGSNLSATVYLGKVMPFTTTPIASTGTSTNVGNYTNLTQVNVNGGYDYYTDGVKVTQLVDVFPANGSEILLGKRTVYGLTLGGFSAGDISATIPATTVPGTYAIA